MLALNMDVPIYIHKGNINWPLFILNTTSSHIVIPENSLKLFNSLPHKKK